MVERPEQPSHPLVQPNLHRQPESSSCPRNLHLGLSIKFANVKLQARVRTKTWHWVFSTSLSAKPKPLKRKLRASSSQSACKISHSSFPTWVCRKFEIWDSPPAFDPPHKSQPQDKHNKQNTILDTVPLFSTPCFGHAPSHVRSSFYWGLVLMMSHANSW